MPELPEVETIARSLQAALAGRRVARVEVRRADVVHGDPTPLPTLLENRRVVAIHRRAKRLIFILDNPYVFLFHLGMSGRLTLHEFDEPIASHTHLALRFKAYARELRFRDPRRFGGVWCFREGGPFVGRSLGPLGPEPLELTPRAFLALRARARRPIKMWLLDQTAIAGLGNIYVDEALFQAGIHPLTPAGDLDEERGRRLLRAIKSILRQAIAHEGSTLSDYRRVDGGAGGFQTRHQVYRKTGLPCPRCGRLIEKITLAARSTHLCPICQPPPA